MQLMKPERTMNEIACIFCHQKSDRTVVEEKGWQGKFCAGCGLVYVSPRPDRDEISNLYAHDQSQVPADVYISESAVSRLRAQNALKLLRRHLRGGSLLEIGAGGGYFLEAARGAGFDPYGIELNTVQADYIRNHLSIPCSTDEFGPGVYPDRTFDIVCHYNVLSHLYDPIEEFRKIHDRLSTKGVLFFETGNFADIDTKYHQLIDNYQYPEHLFFFGERSIELLLQQTGFELLETKGYSRVPNLRLNQLLKLAGRTPYFWRVTRARRTIERLQYHLLYGLGRISPKKGRPQTVLVVARKK
jgi:SAM-dependent methyltransferase